MVPYGLGMENTLLFLPTSSVQVKVCSIQFGNYFPKPGCNKLDMDKQMNNTRSVERICINFFWPLIVFQYIKTIFYMYILYAVSMLFGNQQVHPEIWFRRPSLFAPHLSFYQGQ